MPKLDLSVEDCLSVGDGVFNLGFTYAQSVILNFFYKEQMKFDNALPWQRNDFFLKGLIENQKAIDYSMIYLKYMNKVFKMQNDVLNIAFIDYFMHRKVLFLILFALFLVVMILSILGIICVFMKNLH